MRVLDRRRIYAFSCTQRKYQAGYSTILIATNGERTILNHRGISAGPTGKGLDLDILNEFDWVYPTSLANGGIALLKNCYKAAEAGTVMLNPAGPELAEPHKLKTILDVWKCVNKRKCKNSCTADA